MGIYLPLAVGTHSSTEAVAAIDYPGSGLAQEEVPGSSDKLYVVGFFGSWWSSEPWCTVGKEKTAKVWQSEDQGSCAHRLQVHV